MAKKDPASQDRQATDFAATTAAPPANMPEDRSLIGRAIAVTCTVPGGRRRAGHRFGSEPVVLKVAELTDDQIKQLRQDSDLRIAPADRDA